MNIGKEQYYLPKMGMNRVISTCMFQTLFILQWPWYSQIHGSGTQFWFNSWLGCSSLFSFSVFFFSFCVKNIFFFFMFLEENKNKIKLTSFSLSHTHICFWFHNPSKTKQKGCANKWQPFLLGKGENENDFHFLGMGWLLLRLYIYITQSKKKIVEYILPKYI